MVSFTFAMRCHLIRLAYQRHLHPFLWQSLVGFHLMTTVWNAWQRSRTEGVRKLWSYFRPFVDQSSWNFGTMQETLRTFQRLCEIVYFAFRPEGIRHHHHRHWELIRRPLRCKKTKKLNWQWHAKNNKSPTKWDWKVCFEFFCGNWCEMNSVWC